MAFLRRFLKPHWPVGEAHLAIPKYGPLVAALIAPAATLYDIPALSQNWYAFQDVPQADPRASLILSCFTLTLSILANTLLVLRFVVHLPYVSMARE